MLGGSRDDRFQDDRFLRHSVPDRQKRISQNHPGVVKQIVSKRERKVPGEEEYRKTKKRRQFKGKDDDKSRKAWNTNIKKDLKLRPNERYGLIFHSRHIKEIEKPRKKMKF